MGRGATSERAGRDGWEGPIRAHESPNLNSSQSRAIAVWMAFWKRGLHVFDHVLDRVRVKERAVQDALDCLLNLGYVLVLRTKIGSLWKKFRGPQDGPSCASGLGARDGDCTRAREKHLDWYAIVRNF